MIETCKSLLLQSTTYICVYNSNKHSDDRNDEKSCKLIEVSITQMNNSYKSMLLYYNTQHIYVQFNVRNWKYTKH